MSPTSLVNGIVGTAYSQTVSATGGATPYVFTVAAGALPTWATLNASTGAITGTPNSTTTATFTIRATDANSCSATQAYTATPVCPAISITPMSLAQGTVGSAYSQTLTATGGTAPYGTWTITAGTLPAGLTLNASSGIISGTPTAAASPATSITVLVNDANGCQGTQVISLQICPVITVNPATLINGVVGTAYSQTITATGGSGTYTFSVSAGTLPTWATLNPTTGAITGTPNSTTTANFTIRATDANSCTGTRAYTITPACPTITITPAVPAQMYRNNAYTQTFAAAGGTGAYTWTVSAGTLPAGLALSGAGLLTGTPTALGISSFTLRAQDTLGCSGTLAYTVQVRALTIGNLVFQDNNDNGSLDAGEPGVAGALVQLFRPGADNTVNTGDDVQVGSNFTTLAAGAYSFTDLIPGNYFVKVTPPAGFTTTSGTPATTDNNVDNNNDGDQPGGAGTALFSPIINLAVGAESITDGDTDADTNLTIDFGLHALMSVGNVVFVDVNADGKLDFNEGWEGVLVQIFPQGTAVTGAPAGADMTDNKGRYLITGLNPGSYF
ncbi:MAG: putative Ig domain-containing protein, partial [Verrucomicrobia bacterium]|nr:putative Ig domain-containing protein [Verrucomicrobiota bacterium]